MNIYIASNETDGGIYRYVYENGQFTFADKTDMEKPMYISFDGNKMYVILRAPFENGESGVIAWDLVDGSLCNPSEIVSTEGLCGCHVTSENGDIYAANYLSGSVKKLGGRLVTHQGHGPNKDRQESAHTHQTVLTPDGKYLLAADLGLDSVFVYDRNLEFVSVSKVPEGHGARHMVFNGNLLYCINELISSVTVFEYCEGRLTALDTYPALPHDYKGSNTAAAIRIHGDILYISNRGHDSIARFRIDGKSLHLLDFTPCGGASPRDFNITPDGKYLICTNETTDNVTVFEVSESGLKQTKTEFKIPHPLCVEFK